MLLEQELRVEVQHTGAKQLITERCIIIWRRTCCCGWCAYAWGVLAPAPPKQGLIFARLQRAFWWWATGHAGTGPTPSVPVQGDHHAITNTADVWGHMTAGGRHTRCQQAKPSWHGGRRTSTSTTGEAGHTLLEAQCVKELRKALGVGGGHWEEPAIKDN